MNETLASLLSSRAAERPDHPFVSFPDGEVTYGELHDRAAALARGLLAAGLEPGGHVGILITNCVAYRSRRLRAGPVDVDPCPFFHVGGIGVTVSALVRGATMMSMNWFEPQIALARIERRRAEYLFPAFPPLTLGLLRAPGYDPGRLGFVRTVLNVAPADTQRGRTG